MKKTFFLFVVSIFQIGYSQNETLINYINTYEGHLGQGNLPDSIVLNPTNICDWIGEKMLQYDMKQYTSSVNSFSVPVGDKWDESVYIDYQLEKLDGLLNKYYTILKIQSDSNEFEK